MDNRDTRDFVAGLLAKITELERRVADLETGRSTKVRSISPNSDTAPNDDATLKNESIQLRTTAPVNAAYIQFTNSPGTDSFYLILEEA